MTLKFWLVTMFSKLAHLSWDRSLWNSLCNCETYGKRCTYYAFFIFFKGQGHKGHFSRQSFSLPCVIFDQTQELWIGIESGYAYCLKANTLFQFCAKYNGRPLKGQGYSSVQFSSIQFKVASLRSGMPICAPPHSSKDSPKLPLTLFQRWSG